MNSGVEFHDSIEYTLLTNIKQIGKSYETNSWQVAVASFQQK